MKGISAVIATILMLMITIGLAGMAYTYISGIFTAKTQALEAIDSYCVTNTTGTFAFFAVRNSGTADIGSDQLNIVSINEDCTTDPSVAITITAGSTATLTASTCDRGRPHTYRLRGPSNVVELSAYCA